MTVRGETGGREPGGGGGDGGGQRRALFGGDSATRRAGATSPSRAREEMFARKSARCVTRARAIARCARCRFGPPSRGEVLSRTSERTGRPRRGVRATRGAWGAETRDPRWNTRVHRRDDPSSADASGRDAAGSPRVRASAVGWAGTHQLARALAFALVLSEPVLGELLIALQAAQPLDRLGDVLADVARRLHGRAREKHGHLDRRLRC